jgi:hypothetical protein
MIGSRIGILPRIRHRLTGRAWPCTANPEVAEGSFVAGTPRGGIEGASPTVVRLASSWLATVSERCFGRSRRERTKTARSCAATAAARSGNGRSRKCLTPRHLEPFAASEPVAVTREQVHKGSCPTYGYAARFIRPLGRSYL